jgi:hypothetical protein
MNRLGNRLGLFAVGTLVVAGGIIAVACSDSTTTPLPTPTPTGDGGRTDSGNNTGDGSVVPGDGGGDAANCTARLRPNPEAGAFCPFVPRANDAGVGLNCATGETCCNGQARGGDAGFDPSVCVNGNANQCPAPTNGQPAEAYECAEKDDCMGAQVCCTSGSPGADGGARKPGLGNDQFMCTELIGERGTRCKAQCDPTTDFQVCQQSSECGGGKTCRVVKIGPGGRIQVGICE